MLGATTRAPAAPDGRHPTQLLRRVGHNVRVLVLDVITVDGRTGGVRGVRWRRRLRRSCRLWASGGGLRRGGAPGRWAMGGSGWWRERPGGTVARASGGAGNGEGCAGPGPRSECAERCAGPGRRPGGVHQLRVLPTGYRRVLLIVVPHPHMARVRDRDHEDPRIWKDQSRILGHISAGPQTADALIDTIYQPCRPRTLPAGHRPRAARGSPPPPCPQASAPALPAAPRTRASRRPGHPGPARLRPSQDHTASSRQTPGGHGTGRQPLRDNHGGNTACAAKIKPAP